MKQGKYFSVTHGLLVYVCREGSRIMYRMDGRQIRRIELSGPADMASPHKLGAMVWELQEEDVNRMGLWAGSFRQPSK